MFPDNPLFLECFVPSIIVGAVYGWFIAGPVAVDFFTVFWDTFDRIFPPKENK